jgi:hypothetical protein
VFPGEGKRGRPARSPGMGKGKTTVKERRPAPAPWRNAKSWMQSLFGLGLTASLSPADTLARKNTRDGDKKSEEDSESKRPRDDKNTESSKRDSSSEDSDQNRADRKSEKTNDDQDAEKSGKNRDNSDDSGSGKESKRSQKESDNAASEDEGSSRNKDGKESRKDESARTNDDSAEDTVEDESTQQLSRREARRQAKQEAASDEGEDGDSGGGGKQRSRELEQAANTEDVQKEPDAELIAADDAPATTTPAHIGIAQTNPNVDLDDVPAVDDIPALDDAELIVQGNANVIAAVSTNGGFAFARSGDMTVVSGPDGPRIIQGEIAEVTVPVDEEPVDDGGNNDVDFSS